MISESALTSKDKILRATKSSSKRAISGKALNKLDVEMIVAQHGAYIAGKSLVEAFSQ